MMTALYVFIGILAAALVIYIFNQFNERRLLKIQDKLDGLEKKIDQLLEDIGELMYAKEHPEE